MESDRFSYHKLRGQHHWREEDNQLYVQVNMISRESHDEDYDTPITDSSMDVNCLINKSRIIINFKTCESILAVYASMMQALTDGETDHDNQIGERKEKLRDSLKQEDVNRNNEYHLLRQIVENMALEHGPKLDKSIAGSKEYQRHGVDLVVDYCHDMLDNNINRRNLNRGLTTINMTKQ